jgi:hypothetical protein
MSPIYVPGKVVLAQTYVGIDDPDAAVYITAVEAADTAAGQSGGLETATKVAIHSFVKGCKADGIWPAIKASCILAGARTLTGALIPLAGTAPTNVGGLFVSGDYNRKTGLAGNGTSKYLNSNRAKNADPQDNAHLAVFLSSSLGDGTVSIGAQTVTPASQSLIFRDSTNMDFRLNSQLSLTASGGTATGFVGCTRALSTSLSGRVNGTTVLSSNTSTAPTSLNTFVFCRNLAGVPSLYTASRLAFYSIGESLDLALLDARVTTLINAFAAAIP